MSRRLTISAAPPQSPAEPPSDGANVRDAVGAAAEVANVRATVGVAVRASFAESPSASPSDG